MKNLAIVKVPENYTWGQKKEVEKSVRLAIETTGVVVIPENVEIYSISVND
jgi:hypothetical protein